MGWQFDRDQTAEKLVEQASNLKINYEKRITKKNPCKMGCWKRTDNPISGNAVLQGFFV